MAAEHAAGASGDPLVRDALDLEPTSSVEAEQRTDRCRSLLVRGQGDSAVNCSEQARTLPEARIDLLRIHTRAPGQPWSTG